MTQAKRPPIVPETPSPDPGPFERVRERMRQMAKLALLAATPLTNAPCDPIPRPHADLEDLVSLPTPTCEKSASEWRGFIGVKATWSKQAGERIVLLTITNPNDKPWLQARGPYSVEGGTLLPSTAREPDVLRIKPDADVSNIYLRGTMTCHIVTELMTISISADQADSNPTVTITAD